MKSICLKTNNPQILDYLQEELNLIYLDNVYFSNNEFKNYKNIIVHYTGNDNSLFLDKISSLLSFLVIYEFEESILKRLIFQNYFYFSLSERRKILENCFDIVIEDENYIKAKYTILFKCFKQYLCNHRSIILTGFINFKLTDYIDLLSKIVDDAVNSFIIEKEYMEFISLLKLYINSQKSETELIHLIYAKNFSILLDKDKNIIDTSDNIFKAKFLSDITFSNNDYILNTILNLLPKKIYIHLINNYMDEFVNTLKLIFENRAEICTDCNICKIYKTSKKTLI